MRGNLGSIGWLLAACLLVSQPAIGDGAGREYDYQVSYRGTFSLGQELPIADLLLTGAAATAGAEFAETRLEVSSEAYPVVEALYPIRYRFRSWGNPLSGELVGFESFEQTNRERHRLYLRSDSHRGVQSFDVTKGDGAGVLAQLTAGTRPAMAAGAGALYDRLGLLERVRSRDLRAGEEFRLPVTNGRDRFNYRVKVEGEQMLTLDGRSLPSWKLRFDGYEVGDDGREEVAHRPVFIWLSRDAERIPLRADARHAVGRFRIELKQPAGAARLAHSDG
jgi:hypothetical protein